MQLTLSKYQKDALEAALAAKQQAIQAEQELLAMIFSVNKLEVPKELNYNNGVLSWVEIPKEPEVIEG